MPGIDLSQISSNWRKLQASEKSKSKSEPTKINAAHRSASTNGLKRKKPASRTDDESHAPKRPRPDPRRRQHKMGSTQSSPSTTRNPTKSLLENHDLSPSDIAAAYGAPSSSAEVPLTLPSDTINDGLHPTHKVGKYLALDCEMVGTGPPPSLDSLLARVSIVNYNYEQIYDRYVLPPPEIRITDYRTPVSGIRPEHLDPENARPFAEVQREVAELLHGRVLVGHALRNDLAVLGFGHPRLDMRDTSAWKPFRANGGAPRLRDLALRELGIRIQGGEHSSLEDARAAMGLFRKVKGEWEGEIRKRFGVKRGVVLRKGKGDRGRVGRGREVEGEEDDDDEDDMDFLTGEEEDLEEEEEEEAGGGGASTDGKKTQAKKKKKKSKTKKRTKRK